MPTDSLTSPDLDQLKYKQGTWVDWGRACQRLQKQGLTPQQIFEEAGFQPVMQNQIIVAAQVYEALEQHTADPSVLAYFAERGSDSLYELRILAQADRAEAAELVYRRKLDPEAAREVAKAFREFTYGEVPEGFTRHPGDAVAYQCWRSARQTADLQNRSRFIARGLGFAQSDSARHKLETLLTDFTVVKAKPAPRLPLYRQEQDDDVPRLLPVVGRLPLKTAALGAIPRLSPQGPFAMIQYDGAASWVALPGWQVIQTAQDGVVVIADSKEIGLPAPQEEVLVVVDRAQRTWDEDAHFMYEQEGNLALQWFPVAPADPLLGRVILVMRPKKVFDEDFTNEPWQVDE